MLLLMAGVSNAWAEIVTTPTYYLDDNTGGSWVSNMEDRYTVSTINTSGDGYYTQISPANDGNGANGTSVYTSSTDNLVATGVGFILQFDIKITGGSNQASWFQVNDASSENENNFSTNSASDTRPYAVLQLAQTAANGTEWSINGSGTQSVDLAKDHWYRFKLHRTYNKTYLSIIDRGSDNSSDVSASFFTEAEITTLSATGGLGQMWFATKRYNSSLAIDNIKVQKWGWDVASYSVDLTAVDNDNKVATMPKLYNPDDLDVTYCP